MHLFFTAHFKRSYKNAPDDIRSTLDKQADFLATNPRHPSLRTKKYDATSGIWQARVNKSWRFYFMIGDDRITLLDIMSHPK